MNRTSVTEGGRLTIGNDDPGASVSYTNKMTPRSEEHPMTTPSAANPDPAEVAGLESGGGVAPGDTPPVSASTTGPNHEPPQRSRAPFVVFLVVVGVIVVLIALGLVGRIAGLV
jgi:hypothetical protein